MKKIKKVIPIILAFIIGISTTVGAATVFNSKDITYSSSATIKKNVKDSLDELYTKVNTPWSCAAGWYCYKQVCPDGYNEITDSDGFKICKQKKLISAAKIGSYIKMTPTSTSYTISKDLTGYTSDQTINPSELNLWRIIKVNSDGTVDMVSDKTSSKTVYFRGKNGYINFIKGLNTIAAQYTDGIHVLKAREIGYSNQTVTLTDTSALSKTSVPWKKDTGYGWSGCNSSSYLCGTDEAKGAGDIGYQTDYNLVNSVYGTMTANDPNGTSATYWMASRLYRFNPDSGWGFFGRAIAAYEGDLGGESLYAHVSGFTDITRSGKVRPIVTLKSTTEISSGSGSSESPYELN